MGRNRVRWYLMFSSWHLHGQDFFFYFSKNLQSTLQWSNKEIYYKEVNGKWCSSYLISRWKNEPRTSKMYGRWFRASVLSVVWRRKPKVLFQTFQLYCRTTKLFELCLVMELSLRRARRSVRTTKETKSVAWVRERTISAERRPLVCKVSDNVCG
jgi:hypothetical protein